MFDKRLFSLTPGIGKLVAAKVVALWLSLLADVLFAFMMANLLVSVLQCAIWTAQGLDVVMPANNLLLALLTLLAVCVVKYLTSRSAASFGTEAAERVKLALRERLYRKMLALGPSYSSRVRTSDVVQSAGEGIDQIQSFFELFLPQLFYAVLAPVTLFAVLMPVNIPAAVVLLACAPLIVLVVGVVAMSAARAFKRYWGKYTDMGAAFLDNMQGLETLKAFDADDRAAADMDEKAEAFRVMTMQVLQIQLRSLTAMDAVAYGGTAAGIGVAVWQFLVGGVDMAGAMIVVFLSASFFLPLRQLGSYFHVAMNGMTSTKRIFALLDAPEPERGDAGLPGDGRDLTVTFDAVGYRYADADGAAQADSDTSQVPLSADDSTGTDSDTSAAATAFPAPALTDVSFTARPGTLTAIVGESGSGKSTTAALLAGTLSGYEGSITLSAGAAINGATPDPAELSAIDLQSVELRDLSADAMTSAVSLVSSRSHLFSGTLRENLLMAAPQADDDELWAALELTHIADFVRAQPEGLAMPIAPDATNLSGGQRQRIAIARALLRNTPIYIFDEATSSVDAESEAVILSTIQELAQSATVIMITHRMANAVTADQVVVFDHGHVVETGTHTALMARNGVYADLFRAQQVIEHVGHRSATGARPAVVVDGPSEPVNPVGLVESAEPVESTEPAVRNESVANHGQSEAAAPAGGIGALVRRLLREVGPLRPTMIAACVFGTLGHLSATFLPVFGVFALFAVLEEPVWGVTMTVGFAAMAVCAVIRGLMRYAEQYMNHNVAFKLLALFRSKAFAAMRRLAPAKLDGRGKGDLIALITTDVELLEIFFAHTISPVVIAIVTTVAFAVALAFLNPWFVPLLIVMHLLVGVVLPRLFATGVRYLGPNIRRDAASLDDTMLDDMRGLDEIIRFGAGERRLGSILEQSRELWHQRVKLSLNNGRFGGIGGVMVVLATALAGALALVLAWYGLADVDGVGELFAAVVLIASSFGPTLALSALPASLTQTFASARRLFALMDEVPAVEETGTSTPAYSGMALDHVSFAYPDQKTGHGSNPNAGLDQDANGTTRHAAADHAAGVFTDLSLEIPAHGILGVQGPSGRGKSTMLKLLMRYWDPQAGLVTMSGEDLRTVDAHHRRRVQTMLAQETYLFDGTIRENLLMALGDRTADDGGDAMLRGALAKASALQLVDSLPDGLDTQVGELGGRLSEGERQRIGLARVFLRHADLVLLDEPTSRLDAFNEAVILQSINGLASEPRGGDGVGQGVAIVLVSHRDSTMRVADTVIRV
ncbi:ATP-binding cassette domain-containing protein [Bifidobacterium pullorum subsp. gallinarum]|uniref:ATP-binding cassette domain-containing protein n=1 Tax=Bifidobacterium pullorum subsp. gallinarum TaxID=78344 RepID=A0A4P6DUQ8_9BIFI|nr:ATP-binding cassette domain-containing protein [Bifidobacterium pullorum]QAY33773.1 ATP-binding cassette domain-containing protein [Bifidobacterium pullorum subsp. gallinarum]